MHNTSIDGLLSALLYILIQFYKLYFVVFVLPRPNLCHHAVHDPEPIFQPF